MNRHRRLDLPYCCYVGDWLSLPFGGRGMVHQHYLLGFRHPREFLGVLQAKLDSDVWSNNPYMVSCFHFSRVMVCKRDASGKNHAKPLDSHPDYGKWKDEMDAGEFWSMVGEDWVLGGRKANDSPDCRLEWKDNFYSEDFLKSVDYGCYSPSSFSHTTIDGVYGAYVQEGVCPVHGVVYSRLGGICISGPRHPCGAAQ